MFTNRIKRMWRNNYRKVNERDEQGKLYRVWQLISDGKRDRVAIGKQKAKTRYMLGTRKERKAKRMYAAKLDEKARRGK